MIKDKIYKSILYFISSAIIVLNVVFFMNVIPINIPLYESMGFDQLPFYLMLIIDSYDLISAYFFIFLSILLIIFIIATISNFFIIYYNKLDVMDYVIAFIVIFMSSIFLSVVFMIILYLPIYNMNQPLLN